MADDLPKDPPGVNTTRVDSFSAMLRGLVQNVYEISSMRRTAFSRVLDPRRDINAECGYPDPPITPQYYQDLYDREDTAARVVEVYPKECWQVQPTVYEDEDPNVVTDFEIVWDALGKHLRGEWSYHKQEAGSLIWECLLRADIQSGIGRFGVILIGIDDGKLLSEPARIYAEPPEEASTEVDYKAKTSAEGAVNRVVNRSKSRLRNFAGSGKPAPAAPVPPAPTSPIVIPEIPETEVDPLDIDRVVETPRKLLYLRVFPESAVEIVELDSDLASPRFGQPLRYNITLLDPKNPTLLGASTRTVEVHWTRVLHLADNRSSSEVFGVPRMEQVLNRILDIRKLYAGSPEMYWRGAFFGLSIETHPILGGETEMPRQELLDMMENYMNGLQRYLALSGMSAKPLAPTVVDPTPHVEVQINAICIKGGYPKRIFVGSERGELASGQDDQQWNDRLRSRHINYLTPHVIVPLVDRLIVLGILPQPKRYCVSWPDLTSQTESEKATNAVSLTAAMATYVTNKLDVLIPPLDLLTRIFKFSEEEAMIIIENAREVVEQRKLEDEEARTKEMELKKTMIKEGLVADPTKPPPVTLKPPAKDSPSPSFKKKS